MPKNQNLLAIAAGIFLAVPIARATPFSFTKVADTTDGYSNFSLPAINQQGVVAFNATTNGTAKIFISTGGAAALAYDPTIDGLSSPTGNPAINDAGHIAFVAPTPNATRAQSNVYLWKGIGSPTVVFNAAPTGLNATNLTVALRPGFDAVTYGYMDDSQAHVVVPGATVPLGAHYQLGPVAVSSDGVGVWTWGAHSSGAVFRTGSSPGNYHGGPSQPVTNDPNTLPPNSPYVNNGVQGIYTVELPEPAIGAFAIGAVVILRRWKK